MSMQRCCPPARVDRADHTADSLLFKALADPNRLTMLATMARADDEVCVCDFTDALPLEQPTVSHHLKILRDARLVTCERRGTWVYYRLAAGARESIDGAVRSVIPEKVLA
ncbi:MAG TPA: metalloregulator ArsR/SmtB family transcription factor [Candidatus Limnocylindrales bacterium]|nr:metalloregulator ArsR/SmtB family transcription factor [Candidatus Limnocylindrales bacterium]